MSFSTLKIFAVYVVCGLAAVTTFAGPGKSGGGNMTAAEFLQTAQETIKHAMGRKKVIEFGSRDVELAPLARLLEETAIKVVITQDALTLDGSLVDAINTPSENRIDLSEPRWNKLDGRKKRELAVHEILGLARVEDRNYEISSRIVAVLPDEAEMKRIQALNLHVMLTRLFKGFNDGSFIDGQDESGKPCSIWVSNAVENSFNRPRYATDIGVGTTALAADTVYFRPGDWQLQSASDPMLTRYIFDYLKSHRRYIYKVIETDRQYGFTTDSTLEVEVDGYLRMSSVRVIRNGQSSVRCEIPYRDRKRN